MQNRKPQSSRRRAFTLVEISIVVTVIGIMASLTVYAFGAVRSRRALQDAARTVVAELHKTRVIGLSGRLGDSAAPTVGGPPANSTFNASLDGSTQSYQQTGLRVQDDHTFVFFGDVDTVSNGNEYQLAVVDLEDGHPDGQLRIQAPPVSTEIRFARNTTRVGNVGTITLVNQSNNQQKNITISLTGVPRIQ
ncbi:MAG: type II secretion system protein [Myxococcota bacterium]